jgi:hypothetical protein
LLGDEEHNRKEWIENRLEELASCFAVAVGGFSAMDNHLHVLLRLDPDIAAGWSDEDVVRRWGRLCPPRDTSRRPMPVTDDWIQFRLKDLRWVATARKRLQSVSRFFRRSWPEFWNGLGARPKAGKSEWRSCEMADCWADSLPPARQSCRRSPNGYTCDMWSISRGVLLGERILSDASDGRVPDQRARGGIVCTWLLDHFSGEFAKNRRGHLTGALKTVGLAFRRLEPHSQNPAIALDRHRRALRPPPR